MILLVEDSAISRTDFAETLRHYGYEILEAGDGGEALSLIAKYRDLIDLVITDMIMPRIDGFTLVEDIRVLLPKVPIIGVSAYLSKAGGEKISGRSVDFLEKPIRPSALLAAVQRHSSQSPH